MSAEEQSSSRARPWPSGKGPWSCNLNLVGGQSVLGGHTRGGSKPEAKEAGEDPQRGLVPEAVSQREGSTKKCFVSVGIPVGVFSKASSGGEIHFFSEIHF